MASNRKKKRIKKAVKAQSTSLPSYRARRWTLLLLMSLSALMLIWRAVDQQILETDFLQSEGKRRHLREVEVPAHRGMIADRMGEPLAVSTPVHSVWANPKLIQPNHPILAPLAAILDKNQAELQRTLTKRDDRSFVYLQRRIKPHQTRLIKQLIEDNEINSIGLQREYQRYYPDGEVFSHVIGFTDIDDNGQEGLELAYDEWLSATPGRKRVIRDGKARTVKDVESIRSPRAGRDLKLTLDRRLQFLAYRELKRAVQQHQAISGSAVIMDVRSSEVLAMVNQPAYNPNGSKSRHNGRLRNRAVTDVFEPGSTMKPFTIAAALDTGRFRPDTQIDTSPGTLRLARHLIKDKRNLGLIDVSTVIQKSSNVGASRIALDLTGKQLWEYFVRVGFGELTNSNFPGEAGGQLVPYLNWSRIDQATLSFGYGLSVTTLQLASAYSVLASEGIRKPVSLIRVDKIAAGRRVVHKETARAVCSMMEAVVSPEGTAPAAMIPGYRVAGKTGTVKKSVAGGYAKDKYISVFAGLAPASNPQLVMVVVINEPRAGGYYGGQVAAPVFSRVMTGALRLLNITPDNLPQVPVQLAHQEASG